MTSTQAQHLIANGYVIVRIIDTDAVSMMKKSFIKMLKSFPEYKITNGLQYSKTGFGALATPSSFHHIFVRALRLRAYTLVYSLLKEYDTYELHGVKCKDNKWTGFKKAEQKEDKTRLHPRHLHEIMDRVMVRNIGQSPVKESVHQDISPCFEGDTVFGGWIAFTHQKARLVPKSQRTFVADSKGFAKIAGEKQKEFEGKLETITIPAGCMLVMNQTLIHEVASGVVKNEPILRLFTGWRLTYDTKSLLEKSSKMGAQSRQHGDGSAQNLEEIMRSMAVPKIPSNQMPSMFNVRNIDDTKQKLKFKQWMDTYIDPKLRTEVHHYSADYGKRDAAKRPLAGSVKMDNVVPLFMPPLNVLKKRLTYNPKKWNRYFPEYNEVEVNILKPHKHDSINMGKLHEHLDKMILDSLNFE